MSFLYPVGMLWSKAGMRNKWIGFLVGIVVSFGVFAAEDDLEMSLCRLFLTPQAVHPRTGFVTDLLRVTPETLAYGFAHGFFVWDIDSDTGLGDWYLTTGHSFEAQYPKKQNTDRGVLVFDEMHIPKSLRKWVRQEHNGQKFRITFGQAFTQVMTYAATVDRQDGFSWIKPEFIPIYTELYRRNLAHSVEVWLGDDLVGGLYGVMSGSFFSGESMFSRVPSASRLALLALVARLRDLGMTWIDTQAITGSTAPFNAQYVDLVDFVDSIERANETPLDRAQVGRALRDPRRLRLTLNEQNQPILVEP